MIPNRESRKKPPYTESVNTKKPIIFSGERTVSSTNGSGRTGYPQTKK